MKDRFPSAHDMQHALPNATTKCYNKMLQQNATTKGEKITTISSIISSNFPIRIGNGCLNLLFVSAVFRFLFTMRFATNLKITIKNGINRNNIAYIMMLIFLPFRAINKKVGDENKTKTSSTFSDVSMIFNIFL